MSKFSHTSSARRGTASLLALLSVLPGLLLAAGPGGLPQRVAPAQQLAQQQVQYQQQLRQQQLSSQLQQQELQQKMNAQTRQQIERNSGQGQELQQADAAAIETARANQQALLQRYQDQAAVQAAAEAARRPPAVGH